MFRGKTMYRHKKQVAMGKPTKDPSGKTKPKESLILDFAFLMLCLNHLVCGSLL